MKKNILRYSQILIILWLASVCENCGIQDLPCKTNFTEPQAISSHFQNNIQTNSKISPQVEFSFNPLLLPFKIVYSAQSGFTVENRESTSFITPLGSIDIDYGIGTIRNMNINGHTISSGDFVVGLINKNKKSKEIFLIKGYNKLKIDIEGRTSINAQTGYVEIDVTEAIIKEITFTDISKISIVNTTDFEVQYAVFLTEIESKNSRVACVCSIPPQSYVDSREYVGELNDFSENHDIGTSVTRYIGVVTKRSGLLNREISIGKTQAIQFGEACYINYDSNSSNFYLSKSNPKKNTPKQSLPIPPIATPTSIPENKVDIESATPTEFYGYVSTLDKNSGLNLRNSPSTAIKPKYFIPNGSRIKIINKNIKQDVIDNESGYWHFIEYQDMRGYAWGKFIVIEK